MKVTVEKVTDMIADKKIVEKKKWIYLPKNLGGVWEKVAVCICLCIEVMVWVEFESVVLRSGFTSGFAIYRQHQFQFLVCQMTFLQSTNLPTDSGRNYNLVCHSIYLCMYSSLKQFNFFQVMQLPTFPH